MSSARDMQLKNQEQPRAHETGYLAICTLPWVVPVILTFAMRHSCHSNPCHAVTHVSLPLPCAIPFIPALAGAQDTGDVAAPEEDMETTGDNPVYQGGINVSCRPRSPMFIICVYYISSYASSAPSKPRRSGAILCTTKVRGPSLIPHE
eukprot:1142293-Pelagomonas_calceolata.AAC.1